MKYCKRIHLFSFLVVMGLLFSFSLLGCPSNGSSTDIPNGGDPHTPSYDLPAATAEVPAGHIRVNFKPTKESSAFVIWAWEDFDPAVVAQCVTWPKGIPFTHANGQFICIDLKLIESPNLLGMIIISAEGAKVSGPEDIKLNFPRKYNEIFLKQGNGRIFVNTDMTQEAAGLVSASITGETKIKLDISGSIVATPETLSVVDGEGNALTVSAISAGVVDFSGVNFKSGRKPPYTVTLKDGKYTDTASAILSGTLLDGWFVGTGVNDLGLTLSGANASFKVWAPLAGDVSVLLWPETTAFTPDSATKVAMTFDDVTGVWSLADQVVGDNVWYQYAINNGGGISYVCDIYARAASPDSVAARITDITTDVATMPAGWSTSYVNPFGDNGTVAKSYTEAIIYEMHIRDWSRAFVSDSTGKFKEITSALNDVDGEFYAHLEDLGVTHVQILPSFDYAEKNANAAYNWGYNPYHYDVPEGRYVDYESTNDGRKAVLQMREMIQAFHHAGIAVNLDVVYNHTAGTGSGSLYDLTVPGYFYRMTAAGGYSNGSGCGNETASNANMFRKYMIDSLSHWMTDYHMNGFRFDLMGLHETSTMKEIYVALAAIDPNVMVYGEPWMGGGSPVVKGAEKKVIDDCSPSLAVNGVACFNDDFRNAIKGAEFGGFSKGHVQGKFTDAGIIKGLTNINSFTKKIGRSINYVECHDNYTLADKLAISLVDGKAQKAWKAYGAFTSAEQKTLRDQNKLSAAFVFLAKGTPFINGGQEFMRNKKGDENSYSSKDDINQINLADKNTYAEVYKVYKGLIALRKSAGDSFMGEAPGATAEIVSTIPGYTRYEAGDYLVFFNATATSQDLPADASAKFTLVSVETGVPVETPNTLTKVPATGFVILKK